MQLVSSTGEVFSYGHLQIVDVNGKPKALGPGGVAGGDLSGFYPNPSVIWANGQPTYDLLYYPLSANPAGYITGLTVGTTPISSGTIGRVLFQGAGNVVQQDGSLFWDNTNKRLGIGTASPAQQLHIASSNARVRLESSATNIWDVVSNIGGGSNNDFVVQAIGTRGAIYLGAYATTNTVSVLSNGALVVNSPGNSSFTGTGNVGIGTASPATRLSISASGANGVDIVADASDATQSGRLFFSNGTAGQAITLRNSAGNLFFGGSATAGSSSGSTILWLGSNGNLSVGTTGTSARLHVRGAGSTSATTALRVENSSATVSMVVNDAGNVGVGTASPSTRLDIQGTTATDGGQLGAELLSSSGWTSTDWTGSFALGYTHTVGNTSVLSNTLAAVIGTYYQIAYTITGRTAGSITIAFGGQSLASITATGTFGPLATTTGTLAITPTSDFDGTIVISIRTITAGTALINLRNSAGTVISEVRTSTSNTNTFIGVSSGARITTGTNNVAIGRTTLPQNTTGSNNTAIGVNSLNFNTTGGSNTALGANALQNNISGAANTAIGNNTLNANTTGTTNIAIGGSSLFANTTGSSNVAIGASSMISNVSGSNNVAVGASALRNTTTGSQVAIGSSALQANTTGTNNTAIGNSALTANTTGTTNTAVGGSSLLANTTGVNNVAVGNSALSLNISSSNNVAIGVGALRDSTTGGQTAVGNAALQQNTTGASNTAIGNTALQTNTTGASNTAVGTAALVNLSTGSNNTALGTNAGRYISGGAVNLTNSSNSVFIGNAAYPLADSQTNQIVIGESSVGLGSNTVVLGNTSIVTTQLRGSVISGNQAALATTATDGFLYIPTCAGLPTGVPTAVTGKVPIVADTTNNKLYVYLGGAWTAMN